MCLHYERLVACTELQKCLLCFPKWNIVTCILYMDFATAMHVLLLKNTKGVFPTEGFHLEVYLLVFTRHCVRLAVFQVLLCSLKGRWYERLTHERTFLRWFREVHVCDMHFVYGFCNGNARAAVEEYQRRFPDRRIPSRGVFTRIHQTLRETGCLPSVAG